jgi:hypothetical protein
MLTRVRLVALLAVTASLGPAARAGNQYSFFLGNTSALAGGAVCAIGDDGASLWYNPAGLVVSRRDRLDLSGSAYTLRIREYADVLRADLPDRDVEADPRVDLEATEIFLVPSSVAYVRTLSDDLSLGFGLFVPIRDGFSATSELSIREPQNQLDASLELAADTTVYTASVGLGWRTHPRLRLGVSLGLFYQDVEIEQDLLFGYDSPAAADPSRGNGAVVAHEQIERFGFNLSFGAQWQPSADWALGLVLRTPLIQVYQAHERRRVQLGADVAPDGATTIVSQFAPFRQSGFDASVYLNLAGTLALAWTPKEHAFLALELDLQPGSKDDGVVRDFVWNLRLGGVLPVGDAVRVGAGLFTDRSWEPKPTVAWVDQVHFYGVAGGVYFETPLTLASGADSDSLVLTSTLGLRYALGFGRTLRAVADPTGVRTDPSTTMVDLTFHEIGLHVGSGLSF